jgi:hypothetical protein
MNETTKYELVIKHLIVADMDAKSLNKCILQFVIIKQY